MTTWMIKWMIIMSIFMLMIMPIILKNFHPLNLMILLISVMMLILMLNYHMNKITLYLLMIFISIIGGMMIMFLYFTSLINNYKMKVDNKEKTFFIIMILSNLLISMIMMSFDSIIDNTEYYMNPLNINLIYKYPYNMLTYLNIIYLFFCLTLSMKMCSLKFKPLRKMKN